VAHSQEHNGFYLLLNYDDVKRAMADHKTFSSVPHGGESRSEGLSDA